MTRELQVRYVIDFYAAQPAAGLPGVALHLDVRPALDSPRAVADRARMLARWLWLTAQAARGGAAAAAGGGGAAAAAAAAPAVAAAQGAAAGGATSAAPS